MSHPREKESLELGRALYFHRVGAWDFSCATCHGERGKRIRMQELPFLDRPPAELASTLQTEQMKTISFPEGSLVGDWKRGEAIAQSGRGMTWNDPAGQPGGGSCYNCHQFSPMELSYGTLGPSLRGFGKARGTAMDVQRYVYGKNLVGLLLDAASPVNE